MSILEQQAAPMSEDEKQAQQDAHRDPLSGRAGAHPVGTGVGAAAGGIAGAIAAGAAMGSFVGPVGTAVGAAAGAAAGAVAGGLAGKAVAEEVNPTVEHGYWREQYSKCTYAKAGISYEEYAPAYQLGWEAYGRHQDENFDHAETTLRKDWEKVKGASILRWEEARHATRAAWDRLSKPRNEA